MLEQLSDAARVENMTTGKLRARLSSKLARVTNLAKVVFIDSIVMSVFVRA